MNATTLVQLLADRDPEHDLEEAPSIRRSNLISYLEAMQQLRPRHFWLGEAPGYNGVRRSGIYLISEPHLDWLSSQLSGFQFQKATFTPPKATATSKQIVKLLPLISRLPLTFDVMPFHTFQAHAPYRNRSPKKNELIEQLDILNILIEWFQPESCIAIGRKAELACHTLGIAASYVRHPSRGGQKEFEAGMAAIYHFSE